MFINLIKYISRIKVVFLVGEESNNEVDAKILYELAVSFTLFLSLRSTKDTSKDAVWLLLVSGVKLPSTLFSVTK